MKYLLLSFALVTSSLIMAAEGNTEEERWVGELKRNLFPNIIKFCDSPEGKTSSSKLLDGCSFFGTINSQAEMFCGMMPSTAFRRDLNVIAPDCIPDGLFSHIPLSVTPIFQEQYTLNNGEKKYYGVFKLEFDCSTGTEITAIIQRTEFGIKVNVGGFVPWSCVNAISNRIESEEEHE